MEKPYIQVLSPHAYSGSLLNLEVTGSLYRPERTSGAVQC